MKNNGLDIDKNIISSQVLLNPPVKRKSNKNKVKTSIEANEVNSNMSKKRFTVINKAKKNEEIKYNFINNNNHKLNWNELSNDNKDKKNNVRLSLSTKFNINKNINLI